MSWTVSKIGILLSVYHKDDCKKGKQVIFGAITDNIGIVFYSYAMAINSVSTDPLLAVYPVFVMIGGNFFMKEKVSLVQYIYLLGIVAGSILVVLGTVF